MTKITWTITSRPINDLIPADYNPRQMTEKQQKQLEESLTKFGIAEPIIINKNNVIIGGHQRVVLLKKQGHKEIKVSIPDRELTQEEEKELNIRLNKNLGEWDFDLLANNFDIGDLEAFGFEAKDLKVDFESGIQSAKEEQIKSILQVLVECGDESEQECVYNLLTEAGYKSRIISI